MRRQDSRFIAGYFHFPPSKSPRIFNSIPSATTPPNISDFNNIDLSNIPNPQLVKEFEKISIDSKDFQRFSITWTPKSIPNNRCEHIIPIFGEVPQYELNFLAFIWENSFVISSSIWFPSRFLQYWFWNSYFFSDFGGFNRICMVFRSLNWLIIIAHSALTMMIGRVVSWNIFVNIWALINSEVRKYLLSVNFIPTICGNKKTVFFFSDFVVLIDLYSHSLVWLIGNYC